MSSDEIAFKKQGVTTTHLITFVVCAAICSVLAIVSVQLTPVLVVPGITSIFLAAGVYVPLALWFGVWGCIAAGIAGIVLVSVGTPLPLALIFFVANFIQAFIPWALYKGFFRKERYVDAITVKSGKYAAAFVIMAALIGSLVSGLIGPTGIWFIFGLGSWQNWWVTFTGWFIGDTIVITVLGIPLLRALSARIIKHPAYVSGFLK